MPGLKMLCVFNDAEFAAKGFVSLRSTSYLISSVPSVEEAEREFTRQNFQVLILGPGIVHSDKDRLAIKGWERGCAVIIVSSDEADDRVRADAHVKAEDSMTALVPAVVKAVSEKFSAVAA